MIDRHHLLECILWPNGDGTFRKIINRSKRLKDLGVYEDFKLTIPIDSSTHQTMHREFEKGTEYERTGDKHPKLRKFGDKNPMYGMTGEKHPMYGKSGEKSPRYGTIEDKSPTWKGDKVSPFGLFNRALKRYKRGEITEEELKKFRRLRKEYINERKQLKCQH